MVTYLITCATLLSKEEGEPPLAACGCCCCCGCCGGKSTTGNIDVSISVRFCINTASLVNPSLRLLGSKLTGKEREERERGGVIFKYTFVFIYCTIITYHRIHQEIL